MTTGPDSPQPPQDPHRQPGLGPPMPPQDPHRQPGLGPPMPPQGYGSPGYPVGQPPMRLDEERLWAICAHLGPLVLGIIAPLVIWLVFKDRSAFLDRTGKEALNMQISYLIYGAVAAFTLILLVGLILLPIVIIGWLVLMVVATTKVANFEDYRYPGIIRVVT